MVGFIMSFMSVEINQQNRVNYSIYPVQEPSVSQPCNLEKITKIVRCHFCDVSEEKMSSKPKKLGNIILCSPCTSFYYKRIHKGIDDIEEIKKLRNSAPLTIKDIENKICLACNKSDKNKWYWSDKKNRQDLLCGNCYDNTVRKPKKANKKARALTDYSIKKNFKSAKRNENSKKNPSGFNAGRKKNSIEENPLNWIVIAIENQSNKS